MIRGKELVDISVNPNTKHPFDIIDAERREQLLGVLNELKDEEKKAKHDKRAAKFCGDIEEEIFQEGVCDGLTMAITKIEKYINNKVKTL